MHKKSGDYKFILIFIVTIIVFIFVGAYIVENSLDYRETYRFPLKKDLIFVFYTMPLGAILGLEHIFKERKKVGKWKMNLPRLFILGIPMLLLALMAFIYYYTEFTKYIKMFKIFYNSEFVYVYSSLFKLILGYIIITSFYKSSQDEQTKDHNKQS